MGYWAPNFRWLWVVLAVLLAHGVFGGILATVRLISADGTWSDVGLHLLVLVLIILAARGVRKLEQRSAAAKERNKIPVIGPPPT